MKLEKVTPSRISVLGLLKFLAAIAIVFFHCLVPDQHWTLLWVLVDFFFMITGYFTFRHFQKNPALLEDETLEQKSIKALKYTVKKFKVFVPYVILAIILRYAVYLYPALKSGPEAVLNLLKYLPMDLLGLSSQVQQFDWALWFLSAMLIVFPLFALLCQTKQKYTLTIFAALLAIIYYCNFFHGDILLWPALVRALVGMLAGAVIYVAAEGLRGVNLSKLQRLALQLVEVGCLGGAVVLMSPSNNSAHATFCATLAVFCLAIFLVILLSGQTWSSRISCPFWDFLEQLSMVIYLLHVPLLIGFGYLPFALSVSGYILCAIVLSVGVSLAVFCIWEYYCGMRKSLRH